ncbi:MAG: DUF4258 domain-containing protein [Thermodesulfobacteriota bacterium]
MKFRFSKHAKQEMVRRKISSELVESVLESPQQIISEKGSMKAYHSQIDFGGGKIFLLRVIINDNFEPPVVVTVYRTSKIEKYWSNI